MSDYWNLPETTTTSTSSTGWYEEDSGVISFPRRMTDEELVEFGKMLIIKAPSVIQPVKNWKKKIEG